METLHIDQGVVANSGRIIREKSQNIIMAIKIIMSDNMLISNFCEQKLPFSAQNVYLKFDVQKLPYAAQNVRPRD